MTTQAEKVKLLEAYGFTVGERNPKLNTDCTGSLMVVEPYENYELPTKDGSNGPWCVVGDDLEPLVSLAYEILTYQIDNSSSFDQSKGKPQ